MSLAAIAGWLLAHAPSKRQCAYVRPSEKAEKHHTGEITPTSKTKHPKNWGGLLSLATELLVAVAIRLVQRYLRSWRSALMVGLENSAEKPGILRQPLN